MLFKVESKYVDDVTFLTEKVLNSKQQEIEQWIKDRQQISIEDPDYLLEPMEEEFDWGIDVSFNVKLSSAGIPEKATDGSFIFEDVNVGGDLLHFIAFCFQEGELVLVRECYREAHSYVEHNATPAIHIKQSQNDSGFDIGKWRKYIERKYNIFPPELDEGFVKLFNCGVYVTGGLVISNHIKQQ